MLVGGRIWASSISLYSLITKLTTTMMKLMMLIIIIIIIIIVVVVVVVNQCYLPYSRLLHTIYYHVGVCWHSDLLL